MNAYKMSWTSSNCTTGKTAPGFDAQKITAQDLEYMRFYPHTGAVVVLPSGKIGISLEVAAGMGVKDICTPVVMWLGRKAFYQFDESVLTDVLNRSEHGQKFVCDRAVAIAEWLVDLA